MAEGIRGDNSNRSNPESNSRSLSRRSVFRLPVGAAAALAGIGSAVVVDNLTELNWEGFVPALTRIQTLRFNSKNKKGEAIHYDRNVKNGVVISEGDKGFRFNAGQPSGFEELKKSEAAIVTFKRMQHVHMSAGTRDVLAASFAAGIPGAESRYNERVETKRNGATGMWQIRPDVVRDVNKNTPQGVHYELTDRADFALSAEIVFHYLDYVVYKEIGDTVYASADAFHLRSELARDQFMSLWLVQGFHTGGGTVKDILARALNYMGPQHIKKYDYTPLEAFNAITHQMHSLRNDAVKSPTTENSILRNFGPESVAYVLNTLAAAETVGGVPLRYDGGYIEATANLFHDAKDTGKSMLQAGAAGAIAGSVAYAMSDGEKPTSAADFAANRRQFLRTAFLTGPAAAVAALVAKKLADRLALFDRSASSLTPQAGNGPLQLEKTKPAALQKKPIKEPEAIPSAKTPPKTPVPQIKPKTSERAASPEWVPPTSTENTPREQDLRLSEFLNSLSSIFSGSAPRIRTSEIPLLNTPTPDGRRVNLISEGVHGMLRRILTAHPQARLSEADINENTDLARQLQEIPELSEPRGNIAQGRLYRLKGIGTGPRGGPNKMQYAKLRSEAHAELMQILENFQLQARALGLPPGYSIRPVITSLSRTFDGTNFNLPGAAKLSPHLFGLAADISDREFDIVAPDEVSSVSSISATLTPAVRSLIVSRANIIMQNVLREFYDRKPRVVSPMREYNPLAPASSHFHTSFALTGESIRPPVRVRKIPQASGPGALPAPN